MSAVMCVEIITAIIIIIIITVVVIIVIIIVVFVSMVIIIQFMIFTDFLFPFRLSGLPIFTRAPPLLVTKIEFTSIQETCHAEGFPSPKVTWVRVIMSFPANRTEVKAGNLTISNLRRVDSGLYQCIATNSMGTKKATMNLIVQQGGLYLYFISSNPENLPRLIKMLKVYLVKDSHWFDYNN